MAYKKKTIVKQCVICGNDFEADYFAQEKVTTCSKDCRNIRISRLKLKGIYLQCNMCDKLIYRERTKVKKHNFCSRDCDNLYRRTVKNLGANKKLLKKTKKYYGSDWGIITRNIRKNQNYICADCGISEKNYGKKLSVHHIKPFITFDSIEEANKKSNLVGVCEPCHRKRHSGENHIMKLNPKDLGLNQYSEYGTKNKKDRENAIKILNLLHNTNLKLSEITKIVNVSRTTVERIYKGLRWSELYTGEPPNITNKR